MIDFLLMFFLIPIKVALQISWSDLSILDNEPVLITIATMLFDVVVNLNTGIFVNGKIVKDRIHIIDFYIRSVFLGDFLSLLALIIDFED